MNLELSAEKIAFTYDEMDTNAINFVLKDGYFSVQTCVYLEEDEELNEPSFEWNDQGSSQNGGIKDILFFNEKISLAFEESNLFLRKYEVVEIHLSKPVTKKTVDFFSNYLFLGQHIRYDKDFKKSNIVPQTEERELL
ncbi:hypothetical protein [Collimonas humicola]|uniref:hypothetical protein n=1 Tax=Collimonas humicola TaxID=2825886 RepID=UPI001B8D26D7|nr:hypothetical protein [Collimonas humicola]